MSQPDLLARVLDAVDKDQLIPPGYGVVAAVSGGPDSMALLDLLRRSGRCPLRVAHLNHQLRPGDCDADEQLVADYCQMHDLVFVPLSVDVDRLASRAGVGMEAAGRQARYSFFERCATDWLAEDLHLCGVRVALAHHLDDQSETMLLHLGRGSGLDGLCGMQALTGLVIRPLLGFHRSELLSYLADQQIPWRQDQTNFQPIALRNRLRQRVLPAWADALGFDPAANLARTAQIIRADQDYLMQQTAIAWNKLATVLPGQTIHLDRQAFCNEPEALQNRLLRQAWRIASGKPRDLEWRHIQLARTFLTGRPLQSGHLDWPQGVGLDLTRRLVAIGRHRIEPDRQTVSGSDVTRIDLSQLLVDGSGILSIQSPCWPGQIVLSRLTRDAYPTQKPNLPNKPSKAVSGLNRLAPDCRSLDCHSFEVILPAASLDGALVRGRLPGDRIALPARGLHKSLKKYFNEIALPTAWRDKVPLVARESEIIWFPGMPDTDLDTWDSPGEIPVFRVIFRPDFPVER